jgi:hypothetical protein
MSDQSAADRWSGERTTFQRVYDLIVGAREFADAATFAERADCSETAARNALEQLPRWGSPGDARVALPPIGATIPISSGDGSNR